MSNILLDQAVIEIFAGDTIPFRLSVDQDAGGQPLTNLDGYDLFFTIKASPDDADSAAVFTRSTEAGTIDTFSSSTKAYWRCEYDITKTLISGETYYYDVRILPPDGSVDTLYIGTIKVKQPITRTVTT